MQNKDWDENNIKHNEQIVIQEGIVDRSEYENENSQNEAQREIVKNIESDNHGKSSCNDTGSEETSNNTKKGLV